MKIYSPPPPLTAYKKLKKIVASNKKRILVKEDLKFRNSKFNILCKIVLYFLISYDPLELRRQRGYSGTNKSG